MKKLKVLRFPGTTEKKITFKTLPISTIIIAYTHVYQSTQIHIDMNSHYSVTGCLNRILAVSVAPITKRL